MSFTRILSSVQLGQEATPTLKWSENQRDKGLWRGGGGPLPPIIGLTKSILRCPPPPPHPFSGFPLRLGQALLSSCKAPVSIRIRSFRQLLVRPLRVPSFRFAYSSEFAALFCDPLGSGADHCRVSSFRGPDLKYFGTPPTGPTVNTCALRLGSWAGPTPKRQGLRGPQGASENWGVSEVVWA